MKQDMDYTELEELRKKWDCSSVEYTQIANMLGLHMRIICRKEDRKYSVDALITKLELTTTVSDIKRRHLRFMIATMDKALL